MDDQPSSKFGALVRFGEWLSVHRNFMLFSIIGVGGGSLFAIAILAPGIASQPGDWIVLGVIFLMGGYIWGFLMWQFFLGRLKEWEGRDKRDV